MSIPAILFPVAPPFHRHIAETPFGIVPVMAET